jgi:nucleotide-binding universal stress UspA family protein
MIGTALVPHDLTDDADAAFDALRGLGVPVRHTHVVHVLPRIDPAMPGLVWPRDEDEGRLEHARRAMTARLQGTDLEGAVIHVCIGDPASRIVTLASEIGADLIVVPSHGRHGWKRLLLGSVTAHVSRFARCPVLVVPAGAAKWSGPPVPEAHAEGPFDRVEEVDALGAQITRLVEVTPGWLAALRIAVPEGEDPEWWEEALQQRMATAGIEFVDLTFAPRHTRHAEILDARFEEKFAD